MKKLRLVVAASCLILSACTHVTGSKGPPDDLKNILNGRTVYYDTQAVIGACPSTAREMAPIGPVVGAAIVAQGVSRIGDAIKAAAASDTQTVLARRNVELKTNDGLGECIVIARGWFYRMLPEHNQYSDGGEFLIAGWPFYETKDSKFPANARNVDLMFWRIGLNIAATPDFYFQGKIQKATDGSAYTVMPVEATLDEPISTHTFRPSGKRSVLVALALSEAGAGVDLSKGGGTTLMLGEMAPSEKLTFPPLGYGSCLAFVTTPTEKEQQSIKKFNQCPGNIQFQSLNRSQFESNWFTVRSSDKPKPMLLQALVSETRSPSKFLQFVGDVFGATKETLSQELQQKLIPSQGEQAELAELTTDDTKRTTFDTALAKAIADLNSCISAPTDPGKHVAARISLRALAQAARAVGNTKLDKINPNDIKTNDTTADMCKTKWDQVLAN